jgi:hypothetical protein
MAASSTTTGFPLTTTLNVGDVRGVISGRRRIDHRSGRALEVLGHAIEYLTDEFVQAGGSVSSPQGALEAVQILMAANRQIYFECPEMPSLGERVLSLLGLHTI